MSRLLLAISLDCLLAQAPGTQKWATQVGTLKNKGTTDSSPCLSPDGSLVFVGGNDRPELFFYAINTNDGATGAPSEKRSFCTRWLNESPTHTKMPSHATPRGNLS